MNRRGIDRVERARSFLQDRHQRLEDWRGLTPPIAEAFTPGARLIDNHLSRGERLRHDVQAMQLRCHASRLSH